MPKKRGRPKKVLVVKQSVADFTATIKVLGIIYRSKGATKEEAITNLSVPKGRGTSILTVSNGSKSQEKVFSDVQTSQLFSKAPNVRALGLKNTCLRFDL